MKKIKYTFLAGIIMVLLSACGSDDNQEQNLSDNQQSEVLEESVEQEDNKNDSQYLLGVYEFATEYINFPMGDFWNGQQKEFCEVKLPSEYIVSATYTDEDENTQINDQIYGIRVENIDLDNRVVATQSVTLGNGEGTEIDFTILPKSIYSYEEEKMSVGECGEINLSGNDAFYYANMETVDEPILNLIYRINDDFVIYVTYEGPALDDLGEDQLAENIYNLIEVIE